MDGQTRATDRRQGERRRAHRRPGLAPVEAGPDTQAADSRFAPRSAYDEANAATDGALLRVVHLYAAARAVIGVALVAALAIAATGSERVDPIVLGIAVAYTAAAWIVWLMPRLRRLTDALAQPAAPAGGAAAAGAGSWFPTLGVDLVAFVALHWLDRSSGFNFAALLVLPVLMAGVLMSRMAALAVAAAATLVLLASALQAGSANGDATLMLARAGLAGLGYFVAAVLAGELAARLTREEAAARESFELARQQAQLNRLVIQEMSDGVLVVDRDLTVRAANPAARALLVAHGLSPAPAFGLRERPGWAALADVAAEAFASDMPLGRRAGDSRDVALSLEDGQRRTLRVRVRLTRREQARDRYGVLLLEDLRAAQARSRQEKLAAMGRVSAGIAHEIRNPLAAIAQANALLLEEGLPAPQQRLAGIVADNARRLKRIVDDVMELAPSQAPSTPAIDAATLAPAIVAEWAATNGVAAERVRVEWPPAPLDVRFDPDHLRRVLVNLLDNAHRHAPDGDHAVRVELAARGPGGATLLVASDGEAIAPDTERHLFEPFFSTRSRGSGLGLYICRELCERHRASIDYRARPGAQRWRNEFIVTLRRAEPPQATPSSAPAPTPPAQRA